MSKPTAEQCLLGSMILDNNCISDVLRVVNAGDFSNVSNRGIFEAIVYLHENGPSVDLVSVRNELRVRGQERWVGGVEYLVQLTGSVASAIHAVRFAEIVAGVVVVGIV